MDIERCSRIHKKLVNNRIRNIKCKGYINKEFQKIKKQFVIGDWRYQLNKQKSKVEFLTKKYKIVSEKQKVVDKQVNEMMKKIVVTDEDIEKEEDTKEIRETKNFKTYGDVPMNDQEIAFANLPVDFRLIYTPDQLEIDTEAEKMINKVRYENMKNKTIPNNARESSNDTIKFSDVKATDMRYNGRIFQPALGSRDQELKNEQMKDKYKCIVSKFTQKSKKPQNLSQEQYDGMKSLGRRVKEGELVVNQSDKSKKLIIMPVATYQDCAKIHTDMDTVITWAKVRNIEKEANKLCKALVGLLGMGIDDPNQDRWQTIQKAVDSRPPMTVYNIKDHK